MSLLGRATSRGRHALASRRVSRTARRVKRERLTYLTWEKLETLEWCAREIERRSVPGDVVEAGVALGGSTIVLASALGPARRLDAYDVFGMIPPPGERDAEDSHERYAEIASGRSRGIQGDTYYGYVDDLEAQVTRRLAEHGVPVGDRVRLHRGLFEDTLHPTGPLALVHIDSDWYDPVRLCLERTYPHLSPGGFMVLDDVHDYEGCGRATREFLAGHPDLRVARDRGNVAIERA